jgi:hypothetical protein
VCARELVAAVAARLLDEALDVVDEVRLPVCACMSVRGRGYVVCGYDIIIIIIVIIIIIMNIIIRIVTLI